MATDDRVLGSYEIVAEEPETVAAFAHRAITRLRTVVESCDRGSAVLPLSDCDYLVEMAKCEIDFLLE